jgi:NAD(P)H-nitrite reductase large subunit
MRHVIIGGGPAGMYALDTIRKLDESASITLISDEPAYSRMALPYYLAREIPEEHVLLGNERFFEEMRVDALLGRRVTAINPEQKGPGIPGADGSKVTTLWTLQESQDVLSHTMDETEVVFIGAGFIGFIVINALYKIGCQVSVIEIQDQAERWLNDKGIAVYIGATVTEIGDLKNGRKAVRLSDGRSLAADLVVIATGVRPNTDLVQNSGIQVQQGILVNDRLQTNFPFIYAGGDVAQGPDLSTGRQAIHAIQPTSVDHGRVAGANMAGETVRYPGSLLMNVLDVAGLHCSSFGLWQDDGRETILLQNPNRPIYRKLVWEDDRIVGAIFIGPAEDTAMLTDLGMVKGLIQTKASLGAWKGHLKKYPFDIRRPYRFRYLGLKPETRPTEAHHVMISTQPAE